MKRQFFRVQTFRNRSGSQSFRVSGTDAGGKRVRENYQKRGEAESAADAYEVARLNSGSSLRVIATLLSDEQLADASRALEILGGNGNSLTKAAEFFVSRWRPLEREKSIPAAVGAYVRERTAEFETDDLGRRQLRSIAIELRRFAKIETGLLAELTQASVFDYLLHGRVSVKTQINRRGILSPFFRWCRLKGWMTLDPFADLRAPKRRRKRGTATILSPGDAAGMMFWLEENLPRAVSYFALCLFAGIRPDWRDGEIRKIRPRHIRMDLGLVRIPPDVSKIGEAREITIRPNLREWLEAYPMKFCPPIFPHHRKLLPVLRKRFGLAHDVLRHSFCTYCFEETGSLERTAIESGNSVDMIRNHYRGALDHPEWTAAFWAVKPIKRVTAPLPKAPRGAFRSIMDLSAIRVGEANAQTGTNGDEDNE